MNIPDVARRQAPDSVAAARVEAVRITLVQTGVITVEVEHQLLPGAERLFEVQAQILLVHHLFIVRGVKRAAELVVELVARAAEGEALQPAVVAVVTFTLLVREITGVDFQTIDLF